ncbi:MAG: carbon-nitrogen hydrolase family protein [Thermoproteus sp.]
MLLALVQTNRGASYFEVREVLSSISADVVLLPENWNAEITREEELLRFFSTLPKFPIVVPGAFYVKDGDKIKSRSYILRDGEVLDYCEKIFPSYAVGEAERISPGNKLCAAQYGWLKIGVLICVDLLFPELARFYALRGVNLLLNPANISRDRIPLWRSLALARAFENHMYVAFANNVGGTYADGRTVSGGSVVATPNGYILLEMDERAGFALARLVEDEVEYARTRRRYVDLASRFSSSSLRL